ncbi:MAG: hypothetical protein OIN84_20410 [Candidatus Methanoperedens sp.]|nr:hypothetical protein [Candidatus Methanoperedens sp. BLZ2]MCX9080336.1 hypothetical protein [Candidatus Methanoperedens sp.]
MSQGMRVEFKVKSRYFVLFNPRRTGIVLTPFTLSPSISRTSNRTELIKHLTKIKEKISTVEAKGLDETAKGRNVPTTAHDNAIDMFFKAGISFNRKFDIFMLYINPIHKGKRIT